MNWLVESVGFVAGALTTAAYLPQALRTLRLKETKDISLGMYIMMSLGICLWITYGVLLGSVSVVVANGVSLMLVVAILVMKLRYG